MAEARAADAAALTTPAATPAVHSAKTREEVLREYREYHQATRQRQKQQHKRVIVESQHKRPPRLLLKQEAVLSGHPGARVRSRRPRQEPPKSEAAAPSAEDAPAQTLNDYFKNITRQFARRESLPEGWAADRIRRAMRKYHVLQTLDARRKPKQLYAQSKRLFLECCKCRPLAQGPDMSEDGVLRLGGPNLPKILRILQSKESEGLDLLQPHGLDQCTAVHVAAQRGYTELVRELIEHWTAHPVESPYQRYSPQLLRRLLAKVLQMRKVKALVSESNSELRDLVADIGVSFAHFSDELDKLNDQDVAFEDLLMMCGHPLVLSKDASGNTPLHYAAEAGYLSLCELLVVHGAKISEQNKSGETPLHFAISSQRQEVCQYLVQRRADVRICRYVPLTLVNGVTLRGTFEDSPDGNATCKVMPSLHCRSAGAYRSSDDLRKPRTAVSVLGEKAAALFNLRSGHAPVSPEARAPAPRPPAPAAELESEPAATHAEKGAFRVEALWSSPIFRGRTPRDVLFFRAAPGSSLLKPNLLCVLLIGEHVAPAEVMRARKLHQKGKVFHLLIQNYPTVAVLAMDSFRIPIFRCSMHKGVREHNQQWVVDHKLSNDREKHAALLLLMRGEQIKHKRRKRRRRARTMRALLAVWKAAKRLWKLLRRVRNVLSVQNVFAAAEAGSAHRQSIVCEPKGILYEYVYDHAEFRGGASPTLSRILKTECKELVFHPWVSQLIDHKWNSFARQTFRSDFHIYFVYFVAVFIATYLFVGDTYVGMPAGGYRANSFIDVVGWHEYVRDVARLVYSSINGYYTYREYKAYKDRGSLRTYLRDGWTCFDLVQILCVWMLLITELVETVIPGATGEHDFQLVVYQESLYNVQIWRVYNFRITLMSIVGPQIFIRWIQFARGTVLLGPFVRMIAKMFTDVFVFLLVYCVFLCGFGFTFFILQVEGCRSYVSAIVTVFQISIGSWDWDAIYEGGPVAILHFVVYAVIGTIMLLNLLIAMLGNTYDKIWEDRLLFFALERAKAMLTIQASLDDDEYDDKFWCRRLYALEDDTPIQGLPFQKF